MERTNAQRVDESIDYIKKNISPILATKFNGINKEVAGKQISLKGHHYMPIGWGDQHKAVRALLLCHQHFLDVYAFPDLAKTFYKSKPKKEIDKYISAFVKQTPTAEMLAQKAEGYILNQAKLDYHNRKREDSQISGSAIVCYTGVMLWLFQAGFLTLKGFKNNQVNVNNCNQILGNGIRWDIEKINQIPRGHIWNFQGGSKSVCHWGVSLGNGRAAGTNNTISETVDGRKVSVKFEGSGGMVYGKFDLKSQFDVLKVKYAKMAFNDPKALGQTGTKEVGDPKLFVIDPTKIHFQNDF